MTPAETAASPLAAERPALGVWGRMREDVACVMERDPAARGVMECLLTYPGLHAVIWHRLSHRLWARGWRGTARMMSWMTRFLTNIDIHPGATIGRRLFIDHGAGVVIGETAEIGDDVTLYHGVTLGGTSRHRGKRHPTLEDGVLVGAGAKILGPVVVGRGARVGANSVVIEAVPAGATVVGIPGRVVLPATMRRGSQGIDLDHHLMPDPVGKAIACLLERIDRLEGEVMALRREAGSSLGPDCEPDCEGSCLHPHGQILGGAGGKETVNSDLEVFHARRS